MSAVNCQPSAYSRQSSAYLKDVCLVPPSFATMPRQCEDCARTFAHRQSLFRHKKKCKGSSVHVPMPASYRKVSSDNNNSNLQHIFKAIEEADDKASPDTDDDSVNDHKMDEHSDASSNESDHLNSDDDEKDNYGLWESFVMACRRGDKDIFEKLEGIIPLFKWSESDELFQKLMKDVHSSIHDGFCLKDSFNIAVYANKDAIVEAVNCGDQDDFWSALDRAERDLPPGCKWLTGEDCHCRECFGHSLLTRVRRFVEIFYGMTVDDTMKKILKSEKEGVSVQRSIEQYKKQILEQYEQARSLIDACNIVNDPNRPKFKLQ